MKTMYVVCLVALLSISCTSEHTQSTNAQSQEKAESPKNDTFTAPDFKARDFTSGDVVRLSSFKGKPVVINFWFAGCPPCRWEAPAFKKFAEDNPDISVLSVTDPESNESGAIREFLSAYGWRFPVLLDVNNKIATSFGVEAYPTTFLINRDSQVVGKIVNYLEWETPEMNDALEHLRNGKLVWYYRYLRRKK